MGQYHCGGIERQGLFDDIPRVHAGAIDGAAEKGLKTNHPVTIVQEQCAKKLMVEVPEFGLQESAGGAGAGQFGAPGQGFRKIAPRQFQPGLHLDVARRAKTLLLA